MLAPGSGLPGFGPCRTPGGLGPAPIELERTRPGAWSLEPAVWSAERASEPCRSPPRVVHSVFADHDAGGNNSVVECDLAKVEVAGSNPVSRSNLRSGSTRRLPAVALAEAGRIRRD